MNRYLATSLVATTVGLVLGVVAHGCALNPFAGYSYDEAQKELAGPSSAASGGAGGQAGTGGAGGSGGIGGTAGTGGHMACTCSDDGNECTDDLVDQDCPGGDASKCHTIVVNRDCQTNGKPGICGTTGECKSCQECVDSTCTKRCNGKACITGGVCASGSCVDGYCCNTSCGGYCKACNRVPGTCSDLPVGMQGGGCLLTSVCSDENVCYVPTKKPLGGPLCTAAGECESGACWAQSCVSKNGQPCVENLECSSNLCDTGTHTCVSCEQGFMCPDGAECLPGGRCQVFPGQPAAGTSECVPPGEVADGMTCTLPEKAPCTADFECIYHYCIGAPNGTCAGPCDKPMGACRPGTTCNANGQCRLLPGNYCVVDDQCQGPSTSGKCEGFPRKCKLL